MKRTPLVHIIILLAFLVNTFGPIPKADAQEFVLPAPGMMVSLSPSFNPPILKGIKVHPDNPFRFEFILDKGDSQLGQDQLKDESTKLIKYFLASLTIPEKDLWVNLSPYEKDRIIPNSFGLTSMGRDLLAEDYMLKQITASLIYPEGETGKEFWKRIYEEAAKRFGTTNVPVNTFNKVWIVPEKAVVYENAKAGTAYVVESKLKVMLEQDYLSLEKHNGVSNSVGIASPSARNDKNLTPNEAIGNIDVNALGSQIVREIVIPELTKEVNDDKNFAQLRQVYNSLILATWYKKKIKDSILEQVYADKNKVAGVNIDDPQENEKIYERYLQAFKKGVYNYIKEDVDPLTQQAEPRKYFSGGEELIHVPLQETTDGAMVGLVKNTQYVEDVRIDQAMTAQEKDLLNMDFLDAAYRGDIKAVDESLTKGADINARNQYGTTALMWASLRGHKEVVKLLLAVPGVDINAKNNHSNTALMWADIGGHKDIVKILKAAGATDNAMAVSSTPLKGLRIALIEDNLDLLKKYTQGLSELGADVEAKDNFKNASDIFGLDVKPFDIIMTDLSDSNGSKDSKAGFSVIKEVREKGINTPILISSFFYDVQYLKQVLRMKLGMNSQNIYFLQKPYVMGELQEKINSILTGTAVPLIPSLQPRDRQEIIYPSKNLTDADITKFKETLSEKAWKLLNLDRNPELNIPDFFVLHSNGKGELVIDDDLRAAWNKVKKDGLTVIGRSAHPEEGRRYPFSGQFESFKGLKYLTHEEVLNAGEREKDTIEGIPVSLQVAYRKMVWLASPDNNSKLRKYLDERNIVDYSPEEMDMVVMTEHQLKTFGMFLTSDIHHPSRVNIHFTIRGELKPLATYDHDKTQFINVIDGDKLAFLHPELIGFIKIADTVQRRYGRQQIEVGLSKDDAKVYFFQSRNFSGLEADEVPRYKEYRTMTQGLIAEGFAHVRAPIVVVGDLEKAVLYKYKLYKKYFNEEERLRGTSDIARQDEARKALSNIWNEAVRKYAEEIKAKVHGQDYILLLSDPIALRLIQGEKEDLTLLEEIISKAKVIIGNDTMDMVGHATWDPHEINGSVVIVPRHSDFPWAEFVHNKSKLSPNLLETGDVMEFLSNPDGVFFAPVTPDGQGVGIGELLKGDAAMMGKKDKVRLNRTQENLIYLDAYKIAHEILAKTNFTLAKIKPGQVITYQSIADRITNLGDALDGVYSLIDKRRRMDIAYEQIEQTIRFHRIDIPSFIRALDWFLSSSSVEEQAGAVDLTYSLYVGTKDEDCTNDLIKVYQKATQKWKEISTQWGEGVYFSPNRWGKVNGEIAGNYIWVGTKSSTKWGVEWSGHWESFEKRLGGALDIVRSLIDKRMKMNISPDEIKQTIRDSKINTPVFIQALDRFLSSSSVEEEVSTVHLIYTLYLGTKEEDRTKDLIKVYKKAFQKRAKISDKWEGVYFAPMREGRFDREIAGHYLWIDTTVSSFPNGYWAKMSTFLDFNSRNQTAKEQNPDVDEAMTGEKDRAMQGMRQVEDILKINYHFGSAPYLKGQEGFHTEETISNNLAKSIAANKQKIDPNFNVLRGLGKKDVPALFIRLGEFAVADVNLKEFIPKQYYNHILFIDGVYRQFEDDPFGLEHALPYLAQMYRKRNKFEGANVLELGMGRGIAALFALKLGAQKVVGIEIEEGLKKEMLHNLSLNGYTENQIEFVAGGFNNQEILENLQGHGDFGIVMANIGPHGIYSSNKWEKKFSKPVDSANLEALGLVLKLQRKAFLYIGAGFDAQFKRKKMESDHPSTSEFKFINKNFKINSYSNTWYTVHPLPGEDDTLSMFMSFAAEVSVLNTKIADEAMSVPDPAKWYLEFKQRDVQRFKHLELLREESPRTYFPPDQTRVRPLRYGLPIVLRTPPKGTYEYLLGLYYTEEVIAKQRASLEKKGILKTTEPMQILDLGSGQGIGLFSLAVFIVEREKPELLVELNKVFKEQTLLQDKNTVIDAIVSYLKPRYHFTGVDIIGKQTLPSTESDDWIVMGDAGKALEQAFERNSIIETKKESIENLPIAWSGRFHFAISVQTFRYAEDDELKAWEELSRVLSAQGEAYINRLKEDKIGGREFDIDFDRVIKVLKQKGQDITVTPLQIRDKTTRKQHSVVHFRKKDSRTQLLFGFTIDDRGYYEPYEPKNKPAWWDKVVVTAKDLHISLDSDEAMTASGRAMTGEKGKELQKNVVMKAVWDWGTVKLDQVDNLFDSWVRSGQMDPSDLRILKQILSGDERTLKGLLIEYPKRVDINIWDKRDPGGNGRTVYLKLDKPFPSPDGDITILRIKGARPRFQGNSADLESHVGNGFDKSPLFVDKNGNLVLKLLSRGGQLDPLSLIPQGAMLKERADKEYFLMRAGSTGQGFETDYPIATGVWKKKIHAGRLTGFVIAGMRSEDVRIWTTDGIVDSNYLLFNLVTNEKIKTNLKISKEVYRMIGRSLRAYHDAGYFHGYPHKGNWGVEIVPGKKVRVIIRDLDTTINRNQLLKGGNLKRMEAAYRFLDFHRVISDLSSSGLIHLDEEGVSEKIKPLAESFLEGYFYKIQQVSPGFYRLLQDVMLENFPYTVKLLAYPIFILNQSTVVYGNVWKHLYDISSGADKAMIGEGKKGGIDLTPANMNLQTKMDSRFRGNDKEGIGNDKEGNGDDSGGIKFHLTPTMLQQLQNAPGFVPVIINIQPMTNLREFLGLTQSTQSNVG